MGALPWTREEGEEGEERLGSRVWEESELVKGLRCRARGPSIREEGVGRAGGPRGWGPIGEVCGYCGHWPWASALGLGSPISQ